MNDEQVLAECFEILQLGWAVLPLAAEGDEVRVELEVDLAGGGSGLSAATPRCLVAGRLLGFWSWRCLPWWQPRSDGRV